jgi:nickel transport protein
MKTRSIRVLCCLAALLIVPPNIFGHGVEIYDLTGEGKAVQTIHFQYSTGEPMSFAKIKIFPPSTAGNKVESLVSISDRNGIFCFIPDEEGEWRLDIEDGMGHKGSITINAAPADQPLSAAPEPAKGKLPVPIGIVLGLSIMLNIFAAWHFMGRAKKGGVNAHQ